MTEANWMFDADALRVISLKPPPDTAHLRKVLADAINATDPSDTRLAMRTWGEVPPELVAAFRSGTMPLPRWHQISKLLGACRIGPDAIGQPLPKLPPPAPARAAEGGETRC